MTSARLMGATAPRRPLHPACDTRAEPALLMANAQLGAAAVERSSRTWPTSGRGGTARSRDDGVASQLLHVKGRQQAAEGRRVRGVERRASD